MPRPLIGQTTGDTPERVARPKSPSPAAVESRLREARSSKYVAAVCQLDALPCDADRAALRQALDAAIQAVRGEFADLTLERRPAGVVAKCGLGGTYEVHALDTANATAAHVRAGEALPAGLEQARALALNPNYLFVEVFADAMHAVRSDGTVSVVAFS